MTRAWYFLHLLGFTLWLGGGLASMVFGIAAKREGRAGLGAVVRSQAAVHKAIVGPGALLTVLSGLVLTFSVSADYAGANVWLIVMQGAGVIGALLTLFIAVPTAARVGRLDPAGGNAAYFDELRARLRVVASISGTLGLIALVAGAMVR